MARSLSTASEVSSVDPSGGFSSLLITQNPNDTPTQVTLPHSYSTFESEMSALSFDGGEQGWMFNLTPPGMAQFDPILSGQLPFDFGLTGMDMGGMEGLEGLGGLGGLDGLTLVATPNFTESSSGSPTRLATSGPGSGSGSGSGSGAGGGVGGSGGEAEGVSPGDWAWAGTIAEQIAALFEDEGKAWLAEAEAEAEASVEAGQSGSKEALSEIIVEGQAEAAAQAEMPSVDVEVVQRVEPDVSTFGVSPDRPSSSGSETRSNTPPPVPRFEHALPTPTHTHPVYPYAYGNGTADIPSLAIPIPIPPTTYQPNFYPSLSAHPAHPSSLPLSVPGAASAEYSSRNTSYGSTSSAASSRIITPPSSEYAGQGCYVQQGYQYTEYEYAPTHGSEVAGGQGPERKASAGGYAYPAQSVGQGAQGYA